MIDIRPEHLTLSQLLNGRLFCIPDYQRAYSWGSRERTDLFADVERVLSKGVQGSHFMATIVCLRRQSITLGTDLYQQLDVVDGQQRLTTLIVLLNAIKLSLNPDVPEQDRALSEIRDLLVKVDGDNLLLLQTNHDTSHHFANFLRYGTAPSVSTGKTLADRELLAAINECQEFVESWVMEERGLVDLYACAKNRLSFILHTIADEKLVYTVFEVLNSRGMEVAWFDRLKSILMGDAFELENVNRDQLIRDLHNIWRDTYVLIGLRQGLSTEALRFAATLYKSNPPSKLLSERDSVDEFRSQGGDATNIRKVAQWLLRVTEACDKVLGNRRRNAVTRIAQARLLAVAIHMRDDIEEREREDLLSLWEKITFRIYGMLGYDARTRVGDYVRLAWRSVQGDVAVEVIKESLVEIGLEFPISDAIGELRENNCYDEWQEELRYFLCRYEEYLATRDGVDFKNEQWERIWEASASRSIEHIIPQSKAAEDVRHRLGNLMILPPNLNSKLQDKPPKEKFEAYRNTGLLLAVEVAKASSWTKRAVVRRENDILDWAREEWAD